MPVGAGSAASIGSSIAGGIMGGNAASDATAAAAAASKANNSYDEGILNTTSNNLQPYIQNGGAASNEIANLEGLNGSTGSAAATAGLNTYLGSTNYQFGLGQGEDAIKTAGAASFNSGATAKALDTYATGQAGSALQGYLSTLEGTAGQGESGASTLGSLGNQTAGMVNSNNNNAAGVAASGDYASANYNINALKSLTGSTAGAGTQSSYGPATGGGGNALSGLGGAIAQVAGGW